MLRPSLIAAAVAVLALNIFSVLSNRSQAVSGDVDFRAMYAAGVLLRTQPTALYNLSAERQTQNRTVSGREIGLPYLYPPCAALPFAVLSLLSFRTAYFVFLLLNLSLLIAAACLLRPVPQTLLCFVLFLPTAITLFQGQVSIVLLLALVGSYISLERGRPFLAGLLLATLLVKPQIALPVALLFLFWRGWRLLGGFVFGGCAFAAFSLAAAGPSTLRVYELTLTTATAGALGRYSVFAAPMPNLHGLALLLCNHLPFIGQIQAGTLPVVREEAATLITLILSAGVLLYTALRTPSLPRATVAALLVSYHLHLHDLTLLLLPICLTLVARHARAVEAGSLKRSAAIVWLLSPLHLLLMATGCNGLFALLMVPLLL